MLQPLDEGCSIRSIPVPDGDEHKRLLVRVAIPETDGIFQPTIHYDCIHNQIQSIHNRVCGVVERPTPEGLRVVRLAASAIAATLPETQPDDVYDLARRHGGMKGARYRRAADELTTFGLFPGDSTVKMFVKAERFNPLAKINPDPRAIQFRGAKYCVALAQYLRPIEEHLYQFDKASAGVPRTRNVAKGLNSVARAELLVAKGSAFRSPVYITLDASRFDKHVSEALLKVEHSVYRASNPSEEFAELLRLQLRNRCFSTLGVAYRVRGRRMSGDMNTAIGNVVIMLCMMIAFCDLILGLFRWDCLDDGDDIVVILEEEDVARFRAEVTGAFRTFGMEMKMDEPCRSIHEVEFCQSKVIEYQPFRFKFVRDYRSVLSKATSGVRNWGNVGYRVKVIHAIGTCELILGLGVPVLQAYAQALLRNSSGDRDILRHAPDGLKARALRDARLLGIKDVRHLRPAAIHPVARTTFAEAFGCSESLQLELESFFASWTFDVRSLSLHGLEWEVESWTSAQSTCELYRC